MKSAIIIATKHALLPRQFVQTDCTQSAIRRSKLLSGPGHGLGNPEVLISASSSSRLATKFLKRSLSSRKASPSAYERKAVDLEFTTQRNADLYRWPIPVRCFN